MGVSYRSYRRDPTAEASVGKAPGPTKGQRRKDSLVVALLDPTD